MMDIDDYFRAAYNRVIVAGYLDEIKWCRDRPPFEKCTPEIFFREYVWCVLNAGMKEQIARKIFEKFMANKDPLVVGHLGKRKAIQRAMREYPNWFAAVQRSADPIEYLKTFPWIGDITKYHLARNIGFDCVKPDRHLVRLAEHFKFNSPLEMCEAIRELIPEKLGVIDVVLWRDCNIRQQQHQRTGDDGK